MPKFRITGDAIVTSYELMTTEVVVEATDADEAREKAEALHDNDELQWTEDQPVKQDEAFYVQQVEDSTPITHEVVLGEDDL